MKKIRINIAVSICFIFLLPTLVVAQIVPPQGYVSFKQNFPGDPPRHRNGTQRGYYNYDFEFVLNNTSETLAGTFWSNRLTFLNSDAGLPKNHVGGLQGGYLGVQVVNAEKSIAIFSIWWATDARPGPGAHCVSATEAWYNDDKPWQPRIEDIGQSDAARPLAGGPFKSCRLAITLTKGHQYRLRIFELSDALKPDQAEWWGAWLIDTTNGDEYKIGDLQVPGSWQWLSSASGGFIEHFGPMPNQCDSIPASSSVYFAATADSGSISAELNANLYGACEANLGKRSELICDNNKCGISIKK